MLSMRRRASPNARTDLGQSNHHRAHRDEHVGALDEHLVVHVDHLLGELQQEPPARDVGWVQRNVDLAQSPTPRNAHGSTRASAAVRKSRTSSLVPYKECGERALRKWLQRQQRRRQGADGKGQERVSAVRVGG